MRKQNRGPYRSVIFGYGKHWIVIVNKLNLFYFRKRFFGIMIFFTITMCITKIMRAPLLLAHTIRR